MMRNYIQYLIFLDKKHLGIDINQYKGCPEAIIETEKKYNIKLPKVFRDFVSVMGINGPYCGEEQICGIIKWLTEDLMSDDFFVEGIPKEEQKYIFFFNIFDQTASYFFTCNDEIQDDPVVYLCCYDDGSIIEKSSNRFSYFLNRSDGRDATKFYNEYLRTQRQQKYTIMSMYEQETFLPSNIYKDIGHWYNPKRKIEQSPIEFPSNYIILQSKRLQEIPKNIQNKNELEYLDLNFNEINKIESMDLREFQNLRYLLLGDNEIKRLPGELFLLISLEFLAIQDNKLTTLSEKVGNLENLIELNLNTNDIKEFPKTINRLKNLKFLSVKGNLLEGFPEIKGLDNLLYLNLGYNRIKEFSIDFREVPKLEYLFLPMNELTHVEFKNIEESNIKEIDLGANHLTEFPDVPEEYRDRIIMVGNPLDN